jgi:hypothetical protein
MEDLQLVNQIETLRLELEEAKTGRKLKVHSLSKWVSDHGLGQECS